MKVHELTKLLMAFDPDMEVIIDGDDNGWFGCEEVNTYEDGELVFCNIKSTNEA